MHCITQPISVGKFQAKRNAFDEDPTYQRESGIWSDDKKQLFVDSLRKQYDIPKVYLHDLRGNHPTKEFAVIDGKQRLDAIWCFLNDEFPLGNLDKQQGISFSELASEEQEEFKSKTLDCVLVQDADEEDVEELFSRLNNGEALNAAEQRNAYGGRMAKLVADLGHKNSFFVKKTKFSSKRYANLQAAVKLALIEKSELSGSDPICDLKKKYLDKLVKDGRKMPVSEIRTLRSTVEKRLAAMTRIFSDDDALLDKQAYVPMYYLLVRHLNDTYARKGLDSKIHAALESFKVERAENLKLPEEDRDPVLTEFGRLIQQGTDDRGSLETRVQNLTRYFLEENPDVVAKDKKRLFNDDERHVLWILAGKKCEDCGISLDDLSQMHADHKVRHEEGGVTKLENGQCLCATCNLGKG
jgi:hypothetical protein